MKDHTTNPVVRKTLRDLLLRGLSAIGSKIFQADDCRARDRGWQISPRSQRPQPKLPRPALRLPQSLHGM